MEARPFRGGGPEFQPGQSPAENSTAHPHQTRKQMKTFHNMVERAQQAIQNHGVQG